MSDQNLRKISNNRLIYAITDYLTKSQVEEIIENVLEQTGINDQFDVSVIFYKGKMCKYSYIWVSSEKLFNLLTKFDSTGTTTYSIVANSNSKIPANSTVVSYKNSASTSGSSSLSSSNSSDNNKYLISNKFGVLDMTKEDEHTEIIKSNFEIRNVKITLKTIPYTEEKLKEISIEDPKYTIKECLIEFKPALFQPIDDETDYDKRVHNVWYADKVPKHITVKQLVESLRRFVSNPNMKAPVKFSKNKQLVPYPHINIRDSPTDKKVWVTFDPNSHDGEAALFMCKQLQIGNVKIYFNHFKDRSRDDNEDFSSDDE